MGRNNLVKSKSHLGDSDDLTSVPSATGSDWLPAIDGLRALSVLVVLYQHLTGAHLLAYANIGLAIFFCISGFLMGFILYSEIKETGKIDYKKFYIRRIYRIWPLYFSLIISAAIIGYYNPAEAQPISWLFRWSTFSANYWMASYLAWPPGVTPILWSVCVEEQLYLLTPFIFTIIIRVKISPKIIFRGAIGVELILTALRVIYSSHESHHGNGGLYYQTFSYIDLYFIGSGMAYIFINSKVISHRPIISKILSKKIMYLYLLILIITGRLWTLTVFPPYKWYSPFIYTVLSLLLPLMLLNILSNPQTIFTRLISTKTCRTVGLLSYGMYVTQFLVFQICDGLLKPYAVDGRSWKRVLFVFFLSLSFSSATYIIIERPFLILKNKLHVKSNLKHLSYELRSTNVPWETTIIMGLVGSGLIYYLSAIM